MLVPENFVDNQTAQMNYQAWEMAFPTIHKSYLWAVYILKIPKSKQI